MTCLHNLKAIKEFKLRTLDTRECVQVKDGDQDLSPLKLLFICVGPARQVHTSTVTTIFRCCVSGGSHDKAPIAHNRA
jgi:hypothetical protein